MLPPWIAVLREFADDPEAMFFPLRTKSFGSIAIWASDIRAAETDEDLLELVASLLRATREAGRA